MRPLFSVSADFRELLPVVESRGRFGGGHHEKQDLGARGEQDKATGAIKKSQPGSTSMDAESQIAETLKHAPGLVRRKANDFVKDISGGDLVWIGLTDSHVEGRWKWVDGSDVTFRFWQTGEPNILPKPD
ncbi:hypothetical protein G5714_004427 [Onychostoma macrolepis]|uniref:C-type lectin domain-containing protein n=1 Tax=Onychostoma macrolepis TaxID=369639 RepID=A0A7J6D5I3_9TELE|nr:hypothetical protein G5714_004427 [Onychostoma macrolepis]